MLTLLSGCAITGKHYIVTEDGTEKLVQKLTIDRGGKIMSKTPNGYEMEIDSRERSFYDRYITPLVTGATNRTSATVGVK